jgi:hypothetical protein
MPPALYLAPQLSLDTQLSQLALLGWQSQHAQGVGLQATVKQNSTSSEGGSSIQDAKATLNAGATDAGTPAKVVDTATADYQHMGQSEGGASVTSWGTAAGVKQYQGSSGGTLPAPHDFTQSYGGAHGPAAKEQPTHADPAVHGDLHVCSSAASSVMPSRQVTLSSGGHSDHASMHVALSEGRVTYDSTAGDLVMVASSTDVCNPATTMVSNQSSNDCHPQVPPAGDFMPVPAATNTVVHVQQTPLHSMPLIQPGPSGTTTTASTDADTVQEGFLASVSSLNLSNVPGADIALAAGDFLMKCASGLVLQPSISLAASNASFYSTTSNTAPASGAEQKVAHPNHQQQEQQLQQAGSAVSAPLDWNLLSWASTALAVSDAAKQPPLLLQQPSHQPTTLGNARRCSGTNSCRPAGG